MPGLPALEVESFGELPVIVGGWNMSQLRRILRYSFTDGIPFRSGCVALIVGTILNLINQGDAIFGAMTVNWTKVVLTYVVPYVVSTYGAVSYAMSRNE